MRAVPIGRFRGVPLRLHWSFLLVVPFFAWIMARAFAEVAPPPEAFVWGALLAAGLFASVLVHEIAHTAVALRRGVAVVSITLYPIGGVSAFESAPTRHEDELPITLAGPLASFALAVPFIALWLLDVGAGTAAGLLVRQLGFLNAILGAFNLFVPAFPMDGGRVLRALLSRGRGRARATEIAAGVGRALAGLMVVAGIFGGGILLVAIGIVVWIGAGAEAASVRMEESLRAHRVSDVMRADAAAISPAASVAEAMERMRAARRLTMPLADPDGRPVGVVALRELARVAPEERTWRPVAEHAHADAARVPLDAPAGDVLRALMRQSDLPALVVAPDGRLAGVVTATDVTRFVEIAQATRPRAAPA